MYIPSLGEVGVGFYINMLPVISIIIPCYNSGRFLPEALDSIKAYPDDRVYEVIIVDDGSTDQHTLKLLDELKSKDYTVIHQENKGPAAARNTGIRQSKGEYILFLDSDNKIRAAYIDKGIEILNAYKDVGVVYGNPCFFGDSDHPRFTTQKFDMYKMLRTNYIDMCTVVRKKAWEEVGGLDENRLLMGHEDWEFWISTASKGWKFYYVNEVLFNYRVRSNSLFMQSSETDNVSQLVRYVHQKHLDTYIKYYQALYQNFMICQNDQKRPFRSFIKFIYKKYFERN